MIRQRTIWVAAALLALTPPLSAEVIYVDARQSNQNAEGASWADALPSLQTAISIAHAYDEIWVAAGVYKPAGAGGSRAASFVLRTNVSIFGGFAGTETTRDERDPLTNRTILSGDLNGDDAGGFYADNAYHVLTAESTLHGTLDGCEIMAGRANGSGHQRNGGGLWVSDARVIVRNCVFWRNASVGAGAGVWIDDAPQASIFEDCVFEENAAGSAGGGLMVDDGAPRLSGLRFDRNTASDGGGVALDGDARITNCAFSENVATDTGGGAWISGSARPVFSGCAFSANRASRFGGGAYMTLTAAPRFADCAFVANTSDLNGAGAYAARETAPAFHRCVFEFNDAARHGGGVAAVRDSRPRLVNCTLRDNLAADTGAGAYFYDNADATMVNCAVYRNSALRGGGVAASGFSHVMVVNASICENVAGNGSDGLRCDDGARLNVRNSIIWDHPTASIVVANQGVTTVRHSCVQFGWEGAGNIAADPRFADPAAHDFRLSPDSPCVDAGLTDDAPLDVSDVDDDDNRLEWVPQDLGGKGRFFDEPSVDDDVCLGPPIDMGAFEFGGSGGQPCPGDITGDGFVGLEDIRDLLINYGENPVGDVNCDGRTDLGDLAMMLGQFGRACE